MLEEKEKKKRFNSCLVGAQHEDSTWLVLSPFHRALLPVLRFCRCFWVALTQTAAGIPSLPNLN